MKKQLPVQCQLHQEPMGSVGFFFHPFSKRMGVSILFSVAKLTIIATPVFSICKSSIILPVLMLYARMNLQLFIVINRTTFVSVNNNCLFSLKNIFCGCEFQSRIIIKEHLQVWISMTYLSLKNTWGCEFQWLIVIKEHLQAWISIIYHNMRTFAGVNSNSFLLIEEHFAGVNYNYVLS